VLHCALQGKGNTNYTNVADVVNIKGNHMITSTATHVLALHCPNGGSERMLEIYKSNNGDLPVPDPK
jgi:hypothetical protein